MDLGIKGRVAVVCGASAGLGKATALSLSQEGARVAICARGAEALEKTAEEIRNVAGGEVLAHAVDLTDSEAIDGFFDRVRNELGSPEILVNNAGGPPAGNFEELQDGSWEVAHRLTFQSAVQCCRRVIPEMKLRNWGRILTITSLTVKQPAENLILSNCYRSALTAFSKTLAGDLSAHGITINCVCPGYTDTERLNELAESLSRKQGKTAGEVRRDWERAIPAGRLGRPEEIGAVITFLASEQAGYLTGASVLVDGGLVRALV